MSFDRAFGGGYSGAPGDPAPLAAGWEARAFNEICNRPTREVMQFGRLTVTEICGQRRRFFGFLYACPVCDGLPSWPDNLGGRAAKQ